MLIVSIYRTHRDNTSFGENHPYAECNRVSYADYKEILTTINDKKNEETEQRRSIDTTSPSRVEVFERNVGYLTQCFISFKPEFLEIT